MEWVQIRAEAMNLNPLDRLTSYCDWAVKEFNFDGFHLRRGNVLHNKGLIVAFYRNRDKEAYGRWHGSMGVSKPKDPEIQEIARFFSEAGYECTGELNSIGGVSITITNV